MQLASEHTTGNVGDALVDMLSRLPDAEWIMSTQGAPAPLSTARLIRPQQSIGIDWSHPVFGP